MENNTIAATATTAATAATEVINTTKTQNAFLQAALEYHARNWPSFPITRGETKKPAVKWKELQTRLPTIDELTRWFAKPDKNIGVATGAFSGFFSLDVDDEEGFRTIEAYGGLPYTISTESRPGRQIFWFRHPGWRVANAVRFLPGLDLRGDGGYVQCPPSLHHSGTTYQWLASPDVAPLSEAPIWLLDYTRKEEQELGQNDAPLMLANLNGKTPGDHGKAYALSALFGECEKLANTPDGEKHRRVLQAAIALGGFVPLGAITEQEIEDNLFAVVEPRARDKQNALETIRDGIRYGMARPRQIPAGFGGGVEVKFLRGAAVKSFVEEAKAEHERVEEARAQETEEDSQTDDESDEEEYDADTTTYVQKDGRIVFVNMRKQKDGSEEGSKGVVADFTAIITEQIIPEDGPGFYHIEGKAARGGYFQVDISTDDYSNEPKLKARLQAAAGAQSPVRAGMTKHLGPAISLLTGRKLKRIYSYSRTGWTQEYNRRGLPTGREFFLVPGREEEIEGYGAIQHITDPPYYLDPDADFKKGLSALEALLKAQAPPMACVAAAFAFQAPLSYPAGWRNERYGLFITGQTGSFKSSWAQVLMALYGPEFLNDASLLKFGQGATINALANIATFTHDMPIMVDNYKPNTGRGSDDFVNVIHNILEGAEKRRMKDYKLLPGKPIYCWPLITGEDVPEEDAASLARILVVQFSWPSGSDNPDLSYAQDNASHLCAVGRAWIQWLETEEGRAAASLARKHFPDARSDWRGRLREKQLDMANPLRVASNLATNELTWWTMKQCPALASLADKFTDVHLSGLMEVATSMGSQTSAATEASKFLSVLRELLATERAVVVPYGAPVRSEDRERLLGWRDSTNPKNILLVPHTAREKVLRVLGPNGLNNISKTALTRQLKQMDALADYDPGRGTKKARADSSLDCTQNYLCIKGEFLFNQDDDSLDAQGGGLLPGQYP